MIIFVPYFIVLLIKMFEQIGISSIGAKTIIHTSKIHLISMAILLEMTVTR